MEEGKIGGIRPIAFDDTPKRNDDFSIDIGSIKSSAKKLLSNKKAVWAIVGILFLVVLIYSSSIRTDNLHLLTDQTNGQYIPVALDPFYFLRMAEDMADGGLSEFDPLRKPFDIVWIPEILSDTIVIMHKIANVFGDFSIQYIDIISPVIFFMLGLVAFFFLTYYLTNSKLTALVASAFLAFIPTYLYRTMAGFSDHEAIGMFAFFLALIPLVFLFKNLEKNSEKKSNKPLWIAVLFGVLTTFSIVAWAGMAKFLLIIVPFSYLLFWIIKEDKFTKSRLHFIPLSYILWIVSGSLVGIFTRSGIGGIFTRMTTGIEGILVLFVLGFMIIDYIVIRNKHRIPHRFTKHRILTSLILVIILGFILLPFKGVDPFALFSDFISKLIHPFGTGRVGLTVAENRQPYLQDWLAQIGKNFFWVFVLGVSLLGFDISKKIKSRKYKIGFWLSWIIFISGIMFTRLSSGSILNGTSLASRAFYFGGVLLIVAFSYYLYRKEKPDIKSRLIVLAAFLLTMLVVARGAVRLFFVITPITCLMAGYGFTRVLDFLKKSKGELQKLSMIFISVLVLVLLVMSFTSFVESISNQAKFTGPSAHGQWQKSMAWVRENTEEESIFVHWWDYGYWVQYLGKRPTISDGGHFQGGFRDHMIGRYVLTSPDPDASLSFMKTNDISYLLIDPTDLGKYSAYSSIGSDAETQDRYSWLPIFGMDPSQTQETANSTITVYTGGSQLDGDVIINQDGQEILLPKNRAGIGGVLIESIRGELSQDLSQPTGIYVDNGQQYNLPIRRLFFNGELVDFGSGVDATVYLLTSVGQSDTGLGINNMGAMIYLSEKTQDSLFAQLYLMGDPLERYPTIKLAHNEDDSVVENLKSQGATIKDFIYYQGFRGPISIWKIDYPENIIEREEFLRMSGEFAEFDNLEFVK